MIQALMWKEYREHRAIWLALALVGGGGLFGLSRLLSPEGILGISGSRESLLSVAVLFAWTYGLVCGSMLLANESETGTMTFLDILPVRRLELWLVKYLFGLLMLLGQVAVLIGFVLALDITATAGELLKTLLAMLFFGLLALSWSLLFSARGENVLNVIGLAFIGQIAGVFLISALLLPVAVVLFWFWHALWHGNGEIPKVILICLGILGVIGCPLFGSARLFTQLDRQRNQGRMRNAECGREERLFLLHSALCLLHWLRRLLWLSYTQMRRLLLGLTICSLGLGLLLPVLGPAAWPVLTLLLGVLCGVTVWSDEQLSASFRFLGDQRLPLGRVWIVKVGMRFALAVLAAFLLLLPSLLLAAIHRAEANSSADRVPFFVAVLHSSLAGAIVPVGPYLSLWLLYGFTVGHLCGLLFRKSLVAAVVALGMAGTLVCLWVPSLLGMGLHFWQVAGIPLALLAAGGLLMPAWAADRLLARATFVRLGLALFAAGLWTAGGLMFRVAEIPDMPDHLDMPAFVARIPPMDKGKNDAGLAIRQAWVQVEQLTRDLHTRRLGKPLFPKLRAGDAQDTFSLEINTALERGWPNRPSELGDWLDDKFQEEWYQRLREAADHPLGVVEDPKQLTFQSHLRDWGNLPQLNRVLAVRGLQQQARGDPSVFVDNLRISLALSRNLQHFAPPLVANVGRIEVAGIVGTLDHWLENLHGHPELLQRVRDLLREHEAQLPDRMEAIKAAYLIAQNSLEEVPEKLVDVQVRDFAHRAHAYLDPTPPEARQAEIDAAALFWRVPWEHERHQRILRLIFQGDPWQRQQAETWGGAALTQLAIIHLRPIDKRALARLRAGQLQVAVRLYQAKNHGKPPALLDDLVPGYLPAIPADPYDNQPFRYRVSRGEKLPWFDDAVPRVPQPGAGGMGAFPGAPPAMAGVAAPFAPAAAPLKVVPAGRAILWSVGEDGRDDGGVHQGLPEFGAFPGTDFIYLVPPPSS